MRFFSEQGSALPLKLSKKVLDKLVMTEAVKGGRLKLVLPATVLDVENLNKRIYPSALFEDILSDDELIQFMSEGKMIGAADNHPEETVPPIHGSHLITKAWVESINNTKYLMNEWITLETRNGKDLVSLLEGGATPGVSIRGYGITDSKEGNPDEGTLTAYKYCGTDVVSEPSANLFIGYDVPGVSFVERVGRNHMQNEEKKEMEKKEPENEIKKPISKKEELIPDTFFEAIANLVKYGNFKKARELLVAKESELAASLDLSESDLIDCLDELDRIKEDVSKEESSSSDESSQTSSNLSNMLAKAENKILAAMDSIDFSGREEIATILGEVANTLSTASAYVGAQEETFEELSREIKESLSVLEESLGNDAPSVLGGLGELFEVVSEIQDELDDVSDENEELCENLESVNEELKSAESSFETERATLLEDVREAKEYGLDADDYRHEVSDLKGDREELEREVSRLEKANAKLKKVNRKLNDSLDGAESDLINVERSYKKMKEKRAKEIGGIERKFKAKESDTDVIRDELEELERDNIKKQKMIKKLSSSIESLESKVQRKRKSDAKIKKAVEHAIIENGKLIEFEEELLGSKTLSELADRVDKYTKLVGHSLSMKVFSSECGDGERLLNSNMKY